MIKSKLYKAITSKNSNTKRGNTAFLRGAEESEKVKHVLLTFREPWSTFDMKGVAEHLPYRVWWHLSCNIFRKQKGKT